jgi:hypothetical protein
MRYFRALEKSRRRGNASVDAIFEGIFAAD